MTDKTTNITPGERQSLLRLVKNDFEQVRAELEIQKGRWLQQEYARIEAEHSAARQAIKDYEKAAQAYADKAKAHLEVLWEKHLGKLDMEHNEYSKPSVKFENPGGPPGLIAARNEADAKARRALNTALTNLRREELTAQRTLLVSAIESADARTVLEGLPKAAEAFRTALELVPVQAITA